MGHNRDRNLIAIAVFPDLRSLQWKNLVLAQFELGQLRPIWL